MRRHQIPRQLSAMRTAGVVTGFEALTLLAPPAATAGLAAAPAATHHGATIAVRPHTVHRGGTVTISGRIPTAGPLSCPAGDPATITSTAALFPPDGFGPSAARGHTGRFHVRYTVPRSTKAGTYRVWLRCGGGNPGVSATLHVVR
jgi:hypothetical protein